MQERAAAQPVYRQIDPGSAGEQREQAEQAGSEQDRGHVQARAHAVPLSRVRPS